VGKKHDTLSEKKTIKANGGVTPVAEHLSSKHKALNSIPSPTKKKKKKRKISVIGN
jgi:hypothetical protein